MNESAFDFILFLANHKYRVYTEYVTYMNDETTYKRIKTKTTLIYFELLSSKNPNVLSLSR